MNSQTTRPKWSSVPDEIKQNVREALSELLPKQKKDEGIESKEAYEIYLANYMDENLRSSYNSMLAAKQARGSKKLIHCYLFHR